MDESLIPQITGCHLGIRVSRATRKSCPSPPTIPTPSPPLSSQQLVSVAQVPAVSSVTPATTPTQCHSISASPLTEVHPPPLHFMYWCLMACPGLTSGQSREIIEVPFKSFPHWTPSTELQEDICNVRILKRSVIAIHNDMKTEYTQLRQISPIKIRLKNDVCPLIFATPGLACLSTIKGTPEVPQLHEESVERSGTKRYR